MNCMQYFLKPSDIRFRKFDMIIECLRSAEVGLCMWSDCSQFADVQVFLE
jgi:hypothetical protein